ncbi:MAP7 domain-containing protein 1-like [Anguilla rostrata]|uniref:MAP7 domain-containing protein 1-like n=1 Tax=Anguilla rostrata TaxID=7938 RepID=UPI0030CFC2B6
MAEVAMSLKEMRAQMAAAAQAQADERRSQALSSPGSEEAEGTACTIQIQGARPVIDGAALRIDDKLRVAKERREEQEKQQASRESQILERERKTKQQYERQMEERQKKLEEQRRKEVQRRVAAEEKRKLKHEEERVSASSPPEHQGGDLELAAHSQRAELRAKLVGNQNCWSSSAGAFEAGLGAPERSQSWIRSRQRKSWGGDLTADSGDTGGATVLPPSSPVKSRRKASAEADKRSTSATNLKQQSDSVVNKRLSSSSATIAKSPEKSTKQRSSSLSRLHSNTSHPAKDSHKLPQVEQTGPSQQKRSSSLSSGVGGRLLPSPKIERKGIKNEQARRPPATPPENGTPSRLLTPTKASLARSKSSAALSAGGSDPAVSASPLHLSRGPLRSHSIDRQKGCSDGATRNAQKSEKEKRFSSPGGKRPSSPSSGPGRRRSPSPSPGAPPSSAGRRPSSPASAKQNARNRPPSPSSAKQRPPSPQPSSRPPPIQRPALTPTGPPTLRKRDPKPKESSSPGQPVAPQPAETPPPSNAPNGKSKDDSSAKAIAGTTSAEAAAKMLSENRRLAREQKEREELLRVQREEEERLRKEEEKRLAEEQRVRRAEEEKRRAEEMKILEEEQARMAEEDRVRLEIEEQEKQVELQKEREEAEARALEEAEKQRQERERIMQQNQQERMLRRKRIEEIMKRTRKTDQNDFKRDDEKGMLDENEEEDSEAKEEEETKEEDDCANGEAEFEAEGWSLPGEGPMAEQGGSMYGKLEMDNKENRSILCERDSESVSPTPKALLVEGSEFLNEGSRMGLLPGLNGRAAPWSLEELIELGVRPMAGPLISADGGPDKPRPAFEDKGSAVGALLPGQPIEALSEM